VEQHLALGRELERILGDWRAKDVTAQIDKPRPVAGRHGDARVQVKAVDVGVTGSAREDPFGVRIATDAQDGQPSAPARRDAAEDRGAADLGESRGVLGERICGMDLVAWVLEIDTLALDEADHAPADRGKQPGDLEIGWRGRGEEAHGASLIEWAGGMLSEDALDQQSTLLPPSPETSHDLPFEHAVHWWDL
jgi:hypothetical protein